MAIVASTIIKTDFGEFQTNFHESDFGECVSFSQGDITQGTPIVRLHSACLFGEVFHSLHCDCYHQLTKTMELVQKEKQGVIVYSYKEGRGIGLKGKIQAMEIQRKEQCDTVEAFEQLGFPSSDMRDYKADIGALESLGVAKKVKTFSGNPLKCKAMEDAGYTITEFLKIDAGKLSKEAKEEINTKKEKMGYKY